MPLGPSLLGARSGANLLEPPFAWYAQLLGSSWQAGLGQYKAEQCDNGIAGIAGIAMGLRWETCAQNALANSMGETHVLGFSSGRPISAFTNSLISSLRDSKAPDFRSRCCSRARRKSFKETVSKSFPGGAAPHRQQIHMQQIT